MPPRPDGQRAAMMGINNVVLIREFRGGNGLALVLYHAAHKSLDIGRTRWPRSRATRRCVEASATKPTRKRTRNWIETGDNVIVTYCTWWKSPSKHGSAKADETTGRPLFAEYRRLSLEHNQTRPAIVPLNERLGFVPKLSVSPTEASNPTELDQSRNALPPPTIAVLSFMPRKTQVTLYLLRFPGSNPRAILVVCVISRNLSLTTQKWLRSSIITTGPIVGVVAKKGARMSKLERHIFGEPIRTASPSRTSSFEADLEAAIVSRPRLLSASRNKQVLRRPKSDKGV